AREGRRGALELLHLRFGDEARAGGGSVGQYDRALITDDQRTVAVLFDLAIGLHFGRARRELAAVVPRQLDRRAVGGAGELVADDRPRGAAVIGGAGLFGLDRGRRRQSARPVGGVENVAAHV